MKNWINDWFPSRSVVSTAAVSDFVDHFARQDNWHNINADKGNLGYGWIHYALVRILQPRRVLCIGSRYGFIPACCALACKDNGKGVVDFVDAGFDQDDDDQDHWGGVGFWRKVDSDQHFGKFALEKHIKLHVMLSSDFAKKFPKRKWTYINVDGDHSYKGVKRDFKTFWPRLEKKGMISFHDIYTKDQFTEEYGVHQLWSELTKKYNAFSLPGEFGLGVIQK